MTFARAVAVRLALLTAAWWALLEGRSSLWPAAVPAVAAALAAGLALSPPRRGPRVVRPQAFPFFLWTFVRGSARGAVDVAALAFHPRLSLAPGFVEVPLRLPRGAPQSLFAATVSLLPGTLSARVEEDVLTVHVLDEARPTREALGALESRVGALFGVVVPDES
jgi:multicomponent Na+:H+ antiporter subunit E